MAGGVGGQQEEELEHGKGGEEGSHGWENASLCGGET